MNIDSIKNQFARMGARFQVVPLDDLPRWRQRSDYALDIVAGKHGQIFRMHLSPERERQLEVNVLQCARHDRHLLLLVKTPESKDRFLCGHDEREWFVAAVPGRASSVVQAKLNLQPHAVALEAQRARLSLSQRVRRHNRAFIRQGEWFFLPTPGLKVDERLIRLQEPISRSGGKPHMVAEVYRVGGEEVYLCGRRPHGISATQYHRLLEEKPGAIKWGWSRRFRNAAVYARGTVRHPDHATITLHEWCQVLMNTENTTRQMANVAFID